MTITASDIEREAAFLLKAGGIPAPECEYVPIEGRRFRCDFAWPEQKVALEVEGGSWVQGRHVRGSGFEKDAEKYSLLASEGWLVIRATRSQVEDLSFIAWVRRALAQRVAH